MSGMGLDGVALTCAQLLDKVRDVGVFLVVRSPAERLRDAQWALELEEYALSRGMQLSIRDVGHVSLVFEVNRPGVSCDADDDDDYTDAATSAGGDPLSPSRIESWERHPSQRPRLHLIHGGLDSTSDKTRSDTTVVADTGRDHIATKEGTS